MAEMGISPNRIELESQILCASLRQSWAQSDIYGVIVVAKQLCQLFPDLIRPLPEGDLSPPLDLYELFGLSCDATQNAVVGAYISAVNSFLQEMNVPEMPEEFHTLLDAGYILRKPRLRLSHDLFAVRHWLLERGAIPASGTIDFLEAMQVEKQRLYRLKHRIICLNLSSYCCRHRSLVSRKYWHLPIKLNWLRKCQLKN